MVLKGKYLIIKELTFVKNGQLEILGEGNRITNCIWDDSEAGKWLIVRPGSMQIEIDHNIFKNKVKSNTTLDKNCQLLQVLVRNNNERHHIHHNLFKDIAEGKTDNGFEVIQLRDEFNKYEPSKPNSNMLVENNLFIRCFGESEIVSVKSNGNIIRNNTFRASKGGLVLRHGEGSVVSGNYFLGEGEKSSGGIRIAGINHIISNNYMQDLGDYTIAMMDGTPDGLYTRVENVSIQFNSFINCNKNFVIGLNHAKHPNGTVPRDCKIIGNIFYSAKKNGSEYFVDFVQNDQPENWTLEHNIAFGKKIDNIRGFDNKEIGLVINKEKLFIPTDKTCKISTTELTCELLKYDLFGQSYISNLITVGAIQYPTLKEIKLPLSEASFLKQ
jgi:poly(beta-D-mannuronate) lyase